MYFFRVNKQEDMKKIELLSRIDLMMHPSHHGKGVEAESIILHAKQADDRRTILSEYSLHSRKLIGRIERHFMFFVRRQDHSMYSLSERTKIEPAVLLLSPIARMLFFSLVCRQNSIYSSTILFV